MTMTDSDRQSDRSLPVGTVVTATAPARVDFAGGWSDTWPLSRDLGGRVLNAAVRVGGIKPITASVMRTDADNSYCVCDVTKAPGPGGPDLRLPRAVLALCGNPPGCHVETHCSVPVGSGLGTSSILAGVLLAALWTATGRPFRKQDLVQGVLEVERRMGTNGGWQDQVGGLWGGIKLWYTQRGEEQVPTVEPYPDDNPLYDDLRRRGILWYSGRARAAKDILDRVVDAYRTDPSGTSWRVGILKRLTEPPEISRPYLTDARELATNLNRGREIVNRICPAHWPEDLDRMLDPIRHHLLGYKPCGAGGGGYVVMVATDEGAAADAVETLNRLYPEGRAERLDICREGLEVTVEGPE